MRNHIPIIGSLVTGLFFACLFIACGDKQDESTAKPKVVVQKIGQAEDAGSPPPATSAASRAPTDMGDASPAAEESTVAQTSGAPEKEKVADGPSITMMSYVSAGKLDPFLPLFKEEPTSDEKAEPGAARGVQAKKVKASPKRIPRTPLERMDVSQLKLVAIVHPDGADKPFALVQDNSGKGYVLNKGTYVGTKSGFVTQITKNKVIIEEEEDDEAVDTDGLVTIRKRELVLLKPVGDI
jgi:type IV pilus assembly protein PilP